jgi:hypothetical protein
MTEAEQKELELLRIYRQKTERTLHVIYDLLYFDANLNRYDPEKEWDGSTIEHVAASVLCLMGEPKPGTRDWPDIAGLPSLEKP